MTTTIDLQIPAEYIQRLLDLPRNEFGAIMRALVQYARRPDMYTDALPPAPLSVGDLLLEIVSEQSR